jgi:hypothetical protein
VDKIVSVLIAASGGSGNRSGGQEMAAIGVSEETSTHCKWCGKAFHPRRGGSPQQFCGSGCRTMFWTALRRWAEQALATGVVTIDAIRNGSPAACTLLSAVRSPSATVTVPPRSTGHQERRYYLRQQGLEELMAQAIAARRR